MPECVCVQRSLASLLNVWKGGKAGRGRDLRESDVNGKERGGEDLATVLKLK